MTMGEGGRIAWGRLILGGAFGLVILGALAVLIAPLVAMKVTGGSNYRVHDDGMAPTLLPGDWVLAKRLVPGQDPPRGAIVIYENPRRNGGDLVKRVIGLPGESIQMRGGALYVNGRRAVMEQLDDRVISRWPQGRGLGMPDCINDQVAISGDCHQELWRETLADGTSEIVLNTENKIGLALSGRSGNTDNTEVHRVPRGHVFLMGDNRDNAVDSRSPRHNTVAIHKLQHRVWIIHTSISGTAKFISPRWDRFFREVE